MEWNLEVKLLGQAMQAAAVLEAAGVDEGRKASDQLTLALAAVTEDCPGSGAIWRERQVEARLKLQIYRRHRELLGETLEHSKAALARTEQRLLREMERSESGTMIGTDYGEACRCPLLPVCPWHERVDKKGIRSTQILAYEKDSRTAKF